MSHDRFHPACRHLWSVRLGAFCLLLASPTLAGAEDKAAGEKTPAAPQPATQARVAAAYGRLPLSFEPNQGQTDPQVKFLSRGRGYGLFLTGDEAVLSLRSQKSGVRSQEPAARNWKLEIGNSKLETRNSEIGNQQSAIDNPPAPSTQHLAPIVLRLKLAGANAKAQITGLEELPGKSNYFLGNDPKKWRTNVPNYAQVAYKGVYPGVDLVYYGNQGQLEYDFVVAPGANPRAIRLGIEAGDSKLETDQSSVVSPQLSVAQNGDLVIATGEGEIRLHKPVVYQFEDPKSKIPGRKFLDGRFVLRCSNPKSKVENPKWEVSFEIAKYDARRPLIIDPTLSYSTYLGGSGYDEGYGIAVDSSGNAYVTGYTASSDFPAVSALQPAIGGSHDVFVAKLNAAGDALVYSTYLGGSGYDEGHGIAVDSSGNAYVTGYTQSSDFPTASALQPAFGGNYDAFVTKLNAAGSALVYSTYLGGSAADGGNGIAVDSSGNAYVTGYTASSDFPTASALQPALAAYEDAFVAKLNAAGSSLVYSTYLGGSGEDYRNGIAVDSSGNAYVAGDTTSSNFPTASALQPTLGGFYDAFVAKLNAAGSALVYSTYLGGSADDYSYGGIAVDSSGNAYVTGLTASSDFPTVGALQPALAAYEDAFVTKLNAAGSALIYSSYLGGSDYDGGNGIAVDSSGNTYVAGYTFSSDFPTTPGAYDTTCGTDGTCNAGAAPLSDAFVAKLTGLALPVVQLSPTTLDFGSLGVGFTSAPRTVTLTNVGDAQLIFNSFNVQSDLGPPPWSPVDFTQSNDCGTSLAAGASCTLTVLFRPTAAGTRTAFLVINDNAAGTPHWVSLTGVGLAAPAVTLSTDSLDFGYQPVGATSAPQPVTLTNTGTAALTISDITAPTDFAQTNDCGTLPAVIGIGGSCTISVSFAPSAEGFVVDFLSITDDAPGGSPRQVTLYGTGTPYPVPYVHQPLVPMSAVPGGAGPTLTVNGTGFSSNSVVKWNGSARTTNFVSSTRLTANIQASDVATAGTAWVTVVNPTPGGGTSNVNFLHITYPTSSVLLDKADYAVGTNPQQATTGDFNADGKLDLAVADSGSDAVSVLLGNGNGTFQAPAAFATDCLPLAVSTADFDGDAILDLVTVSAECYSASILLGNGDGTFQPHVDYSITNPGAVATGDFNADGALDLVAASVNAVAVLLGNGDGTFQAPVAYSVSADPDYVTTGDFNGDGILDLVTANSNANTASVLLGNGDGSFLSHVDLAISGTSPGYVTAADLNGDGKLDVAVSSYGSDALSVFLGNGDGSFQSEATYSPGSAPTSVIAGDFNGDGLLDLAVANNVNPGTVSLLLGNGAGGFPSQVSYPTGVQPYWATAGDFNGDGRLDLAAPNYADNTVSVLLQIPVANIAPASLTFADQLVDTPSTPQTATVTNNGSALLTVSGIAFTGANSADFSQTNTCTSGVAPGASCAIDVTFTPAASGARTATLEITDNASGSPHGVALSGNGTEIQLTLSLSTTSLSFGSQVVGTSPSWISNPANTVTVTNTGTVPLNISDISISSATGDFAIALPNTPGPTSCQLLVMPLGSPSLAAGDSCRIPVQFLPTIVGYETGQITITDDATGSPHIVTLSGTGIVGPVVSLSPSSVDFIRHPLNIVDCPAIDVTLANTGDTPLTIESIVPSANFSETHTCGTSLAAGANCKISVKFHPPGLGTTLGTLTITSDAPGSPHTVGLSGTGTLACLLLTSVRSATVVRGTDSASFGVSDSSPSCTTEPIELSCSLQNPAACALSPAKIQPSGSSTLEVSNLRSVTSEWVTVVVNAVSEFRWVSDSLTVLISDFAFTRAPDRATVRAGETTSYALAIRPVNGLAGTVRLSCGGAPRGATCTVAPSTVTLDGSSLGQATVRVTTTARGLAGPGTQLRPPVGLPRSLPLVLGLMSLAALATLRTRRRRAWVALSFSLLLVLVWVACGGGGSTLTSPGSGTPAGTYMLTVTGTYTPPSGGVELTHDTTLTLTVN
jgi:hypothetical protein